MKEEVLYPELPIIDPHHHLWDWTPVLPAAPRSTHPMAGISHQTPRYVFDELLADCRGTGHNVVGTVFVQCGAFYRAGATEAMKVVGEVEFVNGVAAQSASGLYGDFRACAGIVGHADLTLGDGAAAVLEAEVAAGNGRFRGIRHIAAHDADPDVLGPLGHAPAGLFADAQFRKGFAHLGRLGLTFDAWILEPQLPELIALARAFPDQKIVLDHVGTPLGLGVYTGRQEENFARWKASILELAKSPNVFVKLGGLAMPFCKLDGLGPEARPGSERLATLFKPWIETCIEAFGPERGMFESNFPVDRWGADYGTLWNAFKRVTSGASDSERRDLFAGAAARFYSLEGLAL
jgi:predicted TIM-barrel fold metal-dependent hydrolase